MRVLYHWLGEEEGRETGHSHLILWTTCMAICHGVFLRSIEIDHSKFRAGRKPSSPKPADVGPSHYLRTFTGHGQARFYLFWHSYHAKIARDSLEKMPLLSRDSKKEKERGFGLRHHYHPIHPSIFNSYDQLHHIQEIRMLRDLLSPYVVIHT